MGLINIIFLAIAAIMIIESVILLINWCGDMLIERSLNGVLNNQRAEINRLKQQISNNSEQDKHMKNNDKQTVYKIEKGDLVGDIKGDNIIVILMNGDVNGDINSKEGDVVLIRGDINGDVIANKVIRPQQKSDYENYIDKMSSVEKLSKPNKEDEVHCLCAKPNTNCAKCAWYDYVEQECKSWDANEGECQFIDKYESRDNIKNSFKQPPPYYVRCTDCAYAVRCTDCAYSEDYYSSNMYKCSKYDGLVVKDSVRICDSFKQKECHARMIDLNELLKLYRGDRNEL